MLFLKPKIGPKLARESQFFENRDEKYPPGASTDHHRGSPRRKYDLISSIFNRFGQIFFSRRSEFDGRHDGHGYWGRGRPQIYAISAPAIIKLEEEVIIAGGETIWWSFFSQGVRI